MSINYNAYLPTANDIALKNEKTRHIQRKRRERERWNLIYKDTWTNKPFERLLK